MPDRFIYPQWYSEAEQQAIADRAAADLAAADQGHAAYADAAEAVDGAFAEPDEPEAG